MHILMGCMINNKNQYLQNCLIGHGIVLSQQNNYYKIWYINKVYFIIQILNRQINKQFNHLNKNLNKVLKIMDLDLNINFINNDNNISKH